MKIVVVVQEPGKQAEIRAIDNDLDGMSAVIKHGTYDMIEHVSDGPEGMDLWANEEGKYAQDEQGNYLPANIWIFGGADFVMGTVFVAASDDEGETIGLTNEQCTAAINWLASRRLQPQAAKAAEDAVASYFR